MITNVTTERTYTVGFFKAQGKNTIGVTINVVGNSKMKVLREAKELLEQAIKDSSDVMSRCGNENENK
jgi:hypothetical protein